MPERRDSGAALMGRESLLLGAVLIATAVVYLRCLGNGFVFDDDRLIVTNRYIKDWPFLWRSFRYDFWWFRDPRHLPCSRFYRPVADLWLALNYHLFGFDTFGWHAAMVAVHLVTVFLVFKVSRRLAGDSAVALVAALLFGLLPLHAEDVVWPSAIGHLLGGAFEMAAFYLFITPRVTGNLDRPAALLFYAAALLSIESAVMFPLLAASYVVMLETPDATPARSWRRDLLGRDLRRALVRVTPFAIETVLYLIVRAAVLGTDRRILLGRMTMSHLLMTAPSVIAAYLGLLMMPWFANPAHRVFPVRSFASLQFGLAALALAVVAGASLPALRRSPRARLYLFCAVWIAITIAPAMNLPGIRADLLVQDRYLYLPSIASCLLIADLAVRFDRRRAYASKLVWSGGAAVAAAFALSLWNVQRFWHDDLTFAAHCIEVFPEASMYHSIHENILVAGGDFRGAASECDKWLDPNGQPLWSDPGNLILCGTVHAKLGLTAQAALEIARGLTIKPDSDPAGYITLARLYETQGDSAAAERTLRTLLARDPDPPAEAYLKLAELYDAQGRSQESDALLKRAESTPDGAETASLLRAQLKMKHGDAGGAEMILRQLGARYPSDQRVWTMLGLLLADENRGEESLRALARAQQLSPADPEPHFFAARVLHAMGRDRDALQQCRHALGLAPGYDQARALRDEILRNPARG